MYISDLTYLEVATDEIIGGGKKGKKGGYYSYKVDIDVDQYAKASTGDIKIKAYKSGVGVNVTASNTAVIDL
ncbi:hypothetical protein Sta7437_0835 [Stanieria cyanosphaera PCC 7437]|uniref:Uncharacterized protein n=1 Tax=Stanieria cyanosphaera (strain ATCC 29371 / PCC 7437) TaxID=111780 RepID=K9XPG6_STAC7|nr:hypothetical protein [Stanieria cyanosphaera]AFZ34423.1 hypothetical protein Sta7437_0835 [Stanieria cyanosphaera PCC 7437]